MLASLQIKLIVSAVVALLLFGAGWKLRDYQAAVKERKILSDQVDQLATIQKLSLIHI